MTYPELEPGYECFRVKYRFYAVVSFMFLKLVEHYIPSAIDVEDDRNDLEWPGEFNSYLKNTFKLLISRSIS